MRRGGESPAPQVLPGDALSGCFEPLTGQELFGARAVSRNSNVFMGKVVQAKSSRMASTGKGWRGS